MSITKRLLEAQRNAPWETLVTAVSDAIEIAMERDEVAPIAIATALRAMADQLDELQIIRNTEDSLDRDNS